MDPYCINQPVNQYHLIPPTQRSHSESRATSRRPCVSPVVDCTGPGQKLLRGENGWRDPWGRKMWITWENMREQRICDAHVIFQIYIYIYDYMSWYILHKRFFLWAPCFFEWVWMSTFDFGWSFRIPLWCPFIQVDEFRSAAAWYHSTCSGFAPRDTFQRGLKILDIWRFARNYSFFWCVSLDVVRWFGFVTIRGLKWSVGNWFPGKSYPFGGFKYFLFSPLLGEDSHFDGHIFQMGWFNHQTDHYLDNFRPFLRKWHSHISLNYGCVAVHWRLWFENWNMCVFAPKKHQTTPNLQIAPIPKNRKSWKTHAYHIIDVGFFQASKGETNHLWTPKPMKNDGFRPSIYGS